MELTTRPASASDTAFARRVHHQGYREMIERQFGAWVDQDQDRFFAATWATARYDIVLCDGVPCGYVCLEDRATDVQVREIVVLPEFQGRGVGSALLGRVLDRARARKVPVRLRTRITNRAARLYRRLGFRETGRTETHLLLEWGADVSAEDAFDPLELTQEASLNATHLADVAGAEPSLVGRRGWDVLSLQALERLAAETGFGRDETDRDVPRALARALASGDPLRVQDAERVVAPFGRALGHLIATLALDAPGDAEPISPWRRAYRGHWAQVERIWLGGGLAAALGRRLLAAARAEVERLGVRDCRVALAHHPALLALIGVARRRAQPLPHAVVLDFGHSAIKRGIATFDAETLVHLEVLPSVAARSGADASNPADVAAWVVQTMAETFSTAQHQHGRVDPRLITSIGSYVADGWPAGARGTYARLRGLRHDELDAEIQRRTGTNVHTWFVHDGTAAASGLVQPGRAGVIVLGTSLCAGFPVPAETLVGMADDLAVTP